MIKNKIVLFLLLSLFYIDNNKAQNTATNTITLDEVIDIASKNSLDAYKAKRQYSYGYWEYKAFKASLLPSISFNTNPFTYRKSVVERYDSGLNRDVYRPIQSLNSYAGLSISQNLSKTGGVFSVNSNFNKLTTYNDGTTNSYNSTPVNIKFYQPLFAYNSFKWLHKTAPLEYKQSKQQLIYELQNINVKSVSYFFTWALASKRLDMCKEKVVTAKNLFKIGKKRYQLGTIEKEDLLNLELQVYTTELDLVALENNLEQAKNNIKLFLRDDLSTDFKPVLPELISNLKIDLNKASGLYYKNNPQILDLEIQKINAIGTLDKAIKNNRFDLSLNAGYGFNQQAEYLTGVYNNLLEQQNISVNFRIPIVDWGERKGNIKKARMNKEVSDIDIQQEEIQLKENFKTKIQNFNLQGKLVLGALKASEISRESYLITEQRFLAGRVDLLKLTSALSSWQSTTESYMSKLSNYWKFYYEVQQLTLYDFANQKTLKQNYEEIIEN